MMVRRLFRWQDAWFPLTVFSFFGPTVQYVNQVFTTTTRWAVLALFVGILFARGGYIYLPRVDVGRVLMLSGAWAVLTWLWSSVPSLTLMKSVAFMLVALTVFSAGRLWALRFGPDHALDYLLPVVALGLFASAAGVTDPELTESIGQVNLYVGLAGNPNMMGMLMAMATPPLIWRIVRAHSHWMRGIWSVLLMAVIGSLLWSSSRASLLMVLTTGLAITLNLGLRRWILFLVLGVFIVLIAVVVAPGVLEKGEQRFIYKGLTKEEGVLHTREEVWKQSYANAIAGGWLGVGYGVTVGDTGFQLGLKSYNYGREKGNTPLAILEETGLIGLGLYLWTLVLIFGRMLNTIKQAIVLHEKVLFALVTGALGGMVVQSMFEAWWVAPGAPEFVYFWALAGVGVGLSQMVTHQTLWLRAHTWHQRLNWQGSTYNPSDSVR